MPQDSNQSSEDLIAYLDGELGDDAATEVERSLAEDPQMRQQVETLTRTWDLLDLLPAATARDGFTEKTLTAIRSNADLASPESDDDSGAGSSAGGFLDRGRRIGIRLLGLFGLMLAAGIGFGSTFRQNSDPIDGLLNEYPIIQRLDQYREADRVEFLEELHRSGLFDEAADHPPTDEEEAADVE